MSEPADILYDGLTPAFEGEGTRALADALALMVEPLWDIAQSGWGVVFDVEEAPASALGYLAQFSGVTLEDTMTEDEKRGAIVAPSGFAVGTLGAMVDAIQSQLVGSKSVLVVERPLGEAYQLFIRTQAEETPSQQRVRQAILRQKPAGIVLDYDAIDGQTYDELRDNHDDYLDVRSTYSDYSALQADLP